MNSNVNDHLAFCVKVFLFHLSLILMMDAAEWEFAGMWLAFFVFIMLCIGYNFYSNCQIYGIHKHGVITKGVIKQKDYQYITYEFLDKRHEITPQDLYNMVDNFSDHCLPKNIIDLCIQYIGKDFGFFYKLYIKEQKVGWYSYDKLNLRENVKYVNVQYNHKNPEISRLYTDNKMTKSDWILRAIISLTLYICFILMIWYVINALKMDNNINDWNGVLLFIFIPSLILSCGYIAWRSFRNKALCFAPDPNAQLKFKFNTIGGIV